MGMTGWQSALNQEAYSEAKTSEMTNPNLIQQLYLCVLLSSGKALIIVMVYPGSDTNVYLFN